MKNKIVISSSNKKAIEVINKLQSQKKDLQTKMAQNKPLSALKIK